MTMFDRLPVHRQLVTIAPVVTAAALALATSGLIALDLWHVRETAAADATTIARVLAATTAAGVMSGDPDSTTLALSAAQAHPDVARACLYRPDGALLAAFSRSPVAGCPATATPPTSWTVVTGVADVGLDGPHLGRVYVERALTGVWWRAAGAAATGFSMILLAAGAAFLVASRLHRAVSQPIVELARAVRAIDPDAPAAALPPMPAGPNEVGDLVRAFSDTLGRIGRATEALRRKEAEREARLDREREASRLKDQFLATVSHELRTPLNAIVGWTQILSTTPVDDATRQRAIDSLARNARTQARVIEDLVDVSRIVTGRLHLRFSPVDLREVIEGASEVIRPAAQVRRVALSVDLPAQPAFVRGDRDRLQQIVWNLLSNAVKFTGTGGAVHVQCRATDALHAITVRDTGMGIPAAFLPHVFDRFRQADGSTTRAHGGLGLGLAIVKELTELHGGSVDVVSDGPGHGSTFVVHLPVFDGRRSRGAPTPASRAT